jgi:hypothetical protein
MSELLSTGAATWSVETTDAEDTMWWDDADAEENRLRMLGERASKRLLALLQRHHTYGTGELVVPRARSNGQR